MWKGVERGVYDNWADCLRRTQGFEGAQYKSFATREEAERAFSESPYEHLGRTPRRAGPTVSKAVGPCIPQSLAVDAACSGNPGDMEYRGVHVASGRQLFHIGPMAQGTNNIGEFLAIVHALALCAKTGQTQLPIYSDSRNAIAWVKQRHCRTKLAPTAANAPIFDHPKMGDGSVGRKPSGFWAEIKGVKATDETSLQPKTGDIRQTHYLSHSCHRS